MELRRNIDDILYANQLMHVTNYVYKVGDSLFDSI